MWTHENRPKYNRDHLRYPSDLTEDEWAYVEPLIPPAKPGGGKRRTDMRAVMNGVMYFPFRLLAAFDVERVMNAIQYTIALPPDEVVVDRTVRRKILREVAPLATGAQDIKGSCSYPSVGFRRHHR
jgi:hypothetical protein